MQTTHAPLTHPLDINRADLQSAYQAFLQAYPRYRQTAALDSLRASDYTRLDQQGHVYLDYTGGGLYAESQLNAHMAMMRDGVFGNPHSSNLTSMAMTERVEHARAYVLEYFNASPNEYLVIFTPNATGALRLVGESYPFRANDRYLLTFDNHNSVNGIREFARAKGASVDYVPLTLPDLRVDTDSLMRELDRVEDGQNRLFAYPAQSNFTGVQHSLTWIDEAHARGWDVLLDAAAFVPTNRLDLSQWHPDFVDLSFYKMFGYPTGLGCLIARKSALAKLHRPWYSGGTITFSSVMAQAHYLTPGYASFEDGTVNYLGIPAIEIGLKWIDSIGIDNIHTRVTCLTGWLIDQLLALRHANGSPLIHLYGPPNTDQRGGTIQVNFFDPHGEMWSCNDIEMIANHHRISLRAGCHCNPGAREISLNLTPDSLISCFIDKDSLSYEQFLHVINGKTTGALRSSLGIVTNFADVYTYVLFAKLFLDRPVENLS